MKEKDVIKELFSEKLGNYQAPVNPNIWANISAQMSTTSAATATGMSLAAKTIIGLGIAAVATVAVVIVTNTSPSKEKVKQGPKTEANHTNEVKGEPLLKVEPAERVVQNIVPELNSELSFSETETNEVAGAEIATTIGNINSETANTGVVEEEIVEKSVYNENQTVTTEPENVVVETINTEENTKEEAASIVAENEEQITAPVKINLFNVFTPNGDMDNDFLYVESEKLTDFNVVVLNSQNQIVFQSNDQSFKWFGNGMDGSPVPAGNYVYFVTAVDKNGNPVNEHSSLSILR